MKNIERNQELMKLEYDILIKKEAEDGEVYYSISYPELPGLTIYANTVEEGLEEIKNAKEEWFHAAIESGVKIPKPNKKNEVSGRLTLRLPKSLHLEVKTRAETEDISLNAYLNHLIETGLRNEDVSSVGKSFVKELRDISKDLLYRIGFITNKTKETLDSISGKKLNKNEYHFYLENPRKNQNYQMEENRSDKFNNFDKVIPFQAKA